MLVLLFGTEKEFLGELHFHEGAFKQAILSHIGEQLLGSHLARWTTRGIPLQRGFKPKHTKGNEVAYQEFIPARSHEALVALYQWFQDHQLLALDTDQVLLPFWEKLLRLPFTAHERVSLLLALRKTAKTSLAEWRTCFDEMERVHALEVEKFEKEKEKIKSKAAKCLMEGLCELD